MTFSSGSLILFLLSFWFLRRSLNRVLRGNRNRNVLTKGRLESQSFHAESSWRLGSLRVGGNTLIRLSLQFLLQEISLRHDLTYEHTNPSFHLVILQNQMKLQAIFYFSSPPSCFSSQTIMNSKAAEEEWKTKKNVSKSLNISFLTLVCLFCSEGYFLLLSLAERCS